MAVRPSALGVLVVTLLKMLTSTRNKVTKRAILPGMTSMGMRKDIQETITKRPSMKNVVRRDECTDQQKAEVHLIWRQKVSVNSPRVW